MIYLASEIDSILPVFYFSKRILLWISARFFLSAMSSLSSRDVYGFVLSAVMAVSFDFMSSSPDIGSIRLPLSVCFLEKAPLFGETPALLTFVILGVGAGSIAGFNGANCF